MPVTKSQLDLYSLSLSPEELEGGFRAQQPFEVPIDHGYSAVILVRAKDETSPNVPATYQYDLSFKGPSIPDSHSLPYAGTNPSFYFQNGNVFMLGGMRL